MKHRTLSSRLILSLCVVMTGLISVTSCSTKEQSYIDYVDTSIGTGGHGHVFVGANVPFGMVQVGPTSIPQSWDWCSGYHESDSTVIGFSHTHLSGTGIGDLFDVTVMPVSVRDLTYDRGNEQDQTSGLWSYADRTTEVCTPGYYSVYLQRYGITAEMTATERVGLEKYTFKEVSDDNAIIFDLQNGGCWDSPRDCRINVIDNRHIEGWRFSSGWANRQKVYFCAEFDSDFDAVSVHGDSLFYRFDFTKVESVKVKVALSSSSIEGAKKNMAAELTGWDLDKVRALAEEKWNAELSKIKIETSDAVAKKIFYTSMYHTMVAPSLFSDVDQPNRYTTFSLWDTYRAAMPLYSIIHPERENDIMNTFLDIYDKQGDLPMWHLWGCETDCMVGNPGICVAADAIVKGFDGFDRQKMLKAMKATTLVPERGQQFRNQYGYIPYDLMPNENTAQDMEYAIADGALAQAARYLGDEDTYYEYKQKSLSYQIHFDRSDNFMKAVDTKGKFTTTFNPIYAEHQANDYCEGNAWQYTWLVPHDLDGLIECFGDKETLISKLDSLFVIDSDLAGENVSADISGMIGQYAHGNEPSHHIVYFYTMLGQPYKCADLVRQISSELYTDKPDGLSGNEDVGQMSSWYILSSMGFYQVEPASTVFYFGSPLFDKVSISLPNGKEFTLITKDNSDTNRYIQSITFNGEPYPRNYLDYSDIMGGAEVVIQMGPEKTVYAD